MASRNSVVDSLAGEPGIPITPRKLYSVPPLNYDRSPRAKGMTLIPPAGEHQFSPRRPRQFSTFSALAEAHRRHERQRLDPNERHLVPVTESQRIGWGIAKGNEDARTTEEPRGTWHGRRMSSMTKTVDTLLRGPNNPGGMVAPANARRRSGIV